MTLEQTVEIPETRAGRTVLTFTPKPAFPAGRVVPAFTTAPAGDEAQAILAEEARIKALEAKYPIHVYMTLLEAEAAATNQNTPEGREAFKKMLKRTHGALKNSKDWGRGVDVDAKIRALRNEWGGGDE
jgi:hypothetical protein